MPRFYHKTQDEFAPRYGDIDWRAMLMAQLALEETELGVPVWFDSEDGLDVQCTQENTDIYVNRLSDDMDVVMVLDQRDTQRYTFYRSSLGSETFDTLSQTLQELGAAAVHFTVYPLPEIAESWVKQNTVDDLSGFIPDDWMRL